MSNAMPTMEQIEEMSNELVEIFREGAEEQNVTVSDAALKNSAKKVVNALIEVIKDLGLSFYK